MEKKLASLRVQHKHMRPPQTAHRRAAQDISKAHMAIEQMSKDLAEKREQFEKLRVSIEERVQTLQLVVLQPGFDRTASLISPKVEGNEQRDAVPGSVMLHDIGNFKKDNPEAEAFLFNE
eukprot:6320130-Pyramimonas_sp.AAC.1